MMGTLVVKGLNIYKSFMQPHVDYGNVIYNQTSQESFLIRIELIQYNAMLAIMEQSNILLMKNCINCVSHNGNN